MRKFIIREDTISKIREALKDNKEVLHDFDTGLCTLSPYMPTHLDLGDEDCCGIFNSINDDGIVECNECKMTINKAIELLSLKPGDAVKVASALEGAPSEFFRIEMGKDGTLILNDVMGTELSEFSPESIQKTYNDCSACNGTGLNIKQTKSKGHRFLCSKCKGESDARRS